MPFRPTTITQIIISDVAYRFTEHPSAKGMPYGQTGRRATVYQVQNGQDLHALKIFTRAFRVSQIETGAKRIANFARLPGLQVCARQVITRQNHRDLLDQHPDLEYAVLMPWVNGQTWQEILLARQPLTREQSQETAHKFVSILATMEQNQMAHCDLSGPNLLISDTDVALVDVEDLYAPALERPAKLPGGSSGYAHKTASQGLWGAEADRFAGAILIAEILAWCDERIRRVAVGEQYFDSTELQASCDRYNLLLNTLTRQYGHALAEVFTSAWHSRRLEDAPTFADWLKWLDGNSAASAQPVPNSIIAAGAAKKTLELDDTARFLFDSLKNKLALGNLDESEKIVAALAALAPGFTTPAELLEKARQKSQQDDARREKIIHLEQGLAQKRSHLQSIRAEIDRLQGELTETEAACAELEHSLRELSETPPTQPQMPALEKKQPGLANIPSRSPVNLRKKAELEAEYAVEHTGFLGLNLTAVEDALFMPGGKSYATFAADKRMRIWGLDPDVVDVQHVENLCDTPAYAVMDAGKKYLAIGGDAGWVEIYKIQSKIKFIDRFPVSFPVTALSFDSQNEILAVGHGGKLVFYAVKTGHLMDDAPTLKLDADIDGLAYISNNQYLACGLEDGHIHLLQAPDYKRVNSTQLPGGGVSIVTDITGRLLYCGDDSGSITLLSIPELKTLLSFSLVDSSPIAKLALSPENDLLVTSTINGSIHLWRASDGKLMDTVDEHTGAVFGLDFSPTGKHLLSGSNDGRVIVWKIK